MLFARNTQELAAAQADLSTRYSVKVNFVAGDLTLPDDIRRLGQVLREMGGLDILV